VAPRLDPLLTVAESPRPPPALPLTPRNRLAALILEALGDSRARRLLAELTDPRGVAGQQWLAPSEGPWSAALAERAARAAAAMRALPLERAASGLGRTLSDAAALFDAGLFFEVHELLEPTWTAATGVEREVLQGLIQVAVGYQHLANGNLRGAQALLDEGGAKLQGRRLAELDLTGFAAAVHASQKRLGEGFDWTLVPPFPRPP
jgi:predicted metal-dependent hydrolase